MPKAVVLADSLGNIEDGVTVRYKKGATVELSQAEFDRHLAEGVIAKPGKDADAALAASDPAAAEAPPAE